MRENSIAKQKMMSELARIKEERAHDWITLIRMGLR